jgi:hypothetical protein
METIETRTRWLCWRCHKVELVGSAFELGTDRLFLCADHPGGKAVSLAIADARRRRANAQSYATRGIGSRTYLKAIAASEEDKSAGHIKNTEET